MEVIHFPTNNVNPYNHGMSLGLHRQGIKTVMPFIGLKHFFLLCFQSGASLLHLHWVHGPVTGAGVVRTVARVLVFYSALLIWRLRGKKIVWTVHNLWNHERYRLWLDMANSKFVAKLSSVVLVHGDAAVPIVRDMFSISETKLRVIRHGNYAHFLQAHSLTMNHKERRFLFFGVIRPYKGVLELVHGFRSLLGHARLHIAGQVIDSRLQRKLEEQVAMDDRVTIDPKQISNDELKRLLAWSDVIVLPFRDILTSGSLLMALTAGRPVVIPRAGLVSEYANEDCAFFYEVNDQRGLQIALQSALDCDDLEKMAKAALSQSKKYDWVDIGANLVGVYLELLPMKKNGNISPKGVFLNSSDLNAVRIFGRRIKNENIKGNAQKDFA